MGTRARQGSKENLKVCPWPMVMFFFQPQFGGFRWPSSLIRWGIWTSFVAWSLALPTTALSSDKASKPVRVWKVKETPGVPNTDARTLRLGPKTLDSETKDAVVESIPLPAITGLVYGVETRQPVREAKRQMHKDSYDKQKIAEAIAMDPRSAIGVPFIPLMDISEQGILTPFQGLKTHRYFVYVLWTFDGEDHIEVFRLSKRGALSLLAELRKATGKEWDTVDLGEEIDLRHGTPIHLLFNEEVDVGQTVLFPGRYEAILVQRANNSGVLCFLMGEDLDVQHTIARVAVKVSPLAPDQPRTPVVERGADGVLRLVELRMRGQALRLIFSR